MSGGASYGKQLSRDASDGKGCYVEQMTESDVGWSELQQVTSHDASDGK